MFRDTAFSSPMMWLYSTIWRGQATHQVALTPLKGVLFAESFRGQEAISTVQRPRGRG